MTVWRKRLALIFCGILFLAIGLFAALILFVPDSGTPSDIVDFRPTVFQAKADREFFYSIGNQLKRSKEIDPQSATLLDGRIENFAVAPDEQKIAVVVNQQLLIVGTKSVLRRLEPTGSIFVSLLGKGPKPIGKQFFRDDNFQWSRDSRTLFLIRDEYLDSKGSQLFSIKGELWKWDVETGALQLVLKPFPSFRYFLGNRGGIYFSTPTSAGDLGLKYFDGSTVSDIEGSTNGDVSRDRLSRGQDGEEIPFFSFSIHDYERVLRGYRRVELIATSKGQQELAIGHRPYLTLTEGNGVKGGFYCSDMLRSVFLPGERYFLFNARYCGNYNGQLLIDTRSGQYQRLPPETAVYRTLHTDAHPRYRITGTGILFQ